MRTICFLLLIPLAIIAGCNAPSTSGEPAHASRDEKILDSLQFDKDLLAEIREYNNSSLEPFHYSLGKNFENGKEIESDPIRLPGIVFAEKYQHSDELVIKLFKTFRAKGYSIFVVERRFAIDDEPDNIAVLKTPDKYQVLKQVKTDGINYGITTDSLIKIIKRFDDQYSLDLVAASGDWCEFIINKEPANWLAFAKEVYEVCPDVVDQGTGTVEALADEMKRTKKLYFWWD